MMRPAVLVLLCLAALPAAEPTEATPLRWPAGRCSLAEALGRLQVGGNRVWLADGVDDRAEADLPAIDGPWWDGVRAVCLAHGLRPDEGDPADERLDGQGQPVPVGHGTVVLGRGPQPAMHVAGGLLVALDADRDLALWVRSEPRVARGTLAWGRAESVAIAPPSGAEAPEPLESDPERIAALWRIAAPPPRDAAFHATISVATLGRWQATGALTAGQDVRLDAQGREVIAALITAADTVSWQGQPLPERRPLLALALPAELAQGPILRLRSGDAEIVLRNAGGRSAGEGRSLLYRFPRSLPEGRLDLAIEGRISRSPVRIDAALPLPRTPTGPVAPPPEAPSTLRWDAGEAPLAHWLQRLSATGNPVLAEVGVDTAATIAVPAQRGVFWDGVLAVCRASGLAPASDPGPGVAGGAVRLVRRPMPAAAACGPFLVVAGEVERRQGVVTATLRCLVEPRLQPDAFGFPTASWSTWAADEDGAAHPLVLPPPPAGAMTGVRIERAMLQRGQGDAPPLRAEIRLARDGVRTLALEGLLFVPRIQTWHGGVDLLPGQPGEILLGGRAVEITAHAAPVQLNGGMWGPGVVVRGLSGAQSLTYAMASGDGQPLEQAGEANRGGGPLPGRPWLGWCRIPGEGRLTATLAARAALPPLVMPLRIVIAPGEGL